MTESLANYETEKEARQNPEKNAKIDAWIQANSDDYDYLQELDKERLVRKYILDAKVMPAERIEKYRQRKEAEEYLEHNPAIRKDLEERFEQIKQNMLLDEVAQKHLSESKKKSEGVTVTPY